MVTLLNWQADSLEKSICKCQYFLCVPVNCFYGGFYAWSTESSNQNWQGQSFYSPCSSQINFIQFFFILYCKKSFKQLENNLFQSKIKQKQLQNFKFFLKSCPFFAQQQDGLFNLNIGEHSQQNSTIVTYSCHTDKQYLFLVNFSCTDIQRETLLIFCGLQEHRCWAWC